MSSTPSWGDWLEHHANLRVHAGLRCRPAQRIDADLAAMLALPPVAPDTDWHSDTRLAADHWVRVDTNDYSVHPVAIGRRIHIRVDADTVTVTCGRDVSHVTIGCSHAT